MNKNKYVQERSICVLYLTATCNLKCRYCYIDKSEILTQIDKILEKSFQGNYYFNFMKEMFPDKKQLHSIEFWGGEPSYGLHRVKETVINAINYYPNLNSFTMSTNLTTDMGLKDLFDFWKIFANFPNRLFTFNLQLSLDGPTYINDTNRGTNTTKKFVEHFSKMLFEMDNLLQEVPNLRINAFFKPTLDSSSIAQLQSKEKIIEYYQFFENFEEASLKYVSNPNWGLSLSNPNTATPSPHTIEDGKNFANLIKICNSLVKEDFGKKYFKYPRVTVPFLAINAQDVIYNEPRVCLNNGCGTCGTGGCVLGLLPNKFISVCHNGFVDLLADYKLKSKENIDKADRTIDSSLFLLDMKSPSIYNVKDYFKYEEQVHAFLPSSHWQIEELSSLIQLYAAAGQIDKKYVKNDEAIKAAHFIQSHTASCIRDNIGVTGSKFLFQSGFIKLFLNGAKEEMEDVE